MNGEAVPHSGERLWRAGQWFSVSLVAVLLAGLLSGAEAALTVLWSVLIPLLPASFLVSPAIWRNVCPLATLNMLSNRAVRPRVPSLVWLRHARLAGMVLLLLLVPARHFLFNTSGVALAITIMAVAVLALGLGSVFTTKSGFCNAICPVLPVEQLYGQSPFISIGNSRCTSCTSCTVTGCIDVSGAKVVAQRLGRSRRSSAWLHSHFGMFAAAFPGFVLAYFVTPDGPLSSAGTVYLTALGLAVVSWSVTYAAVHALRLRSMEAMRLLAACAAGIYYWFVAPALTAAVTAPDWTTIVIRIAAAALIGAWLVVAWRRQSGRPVRDLAAIS